MFLGYEVLIFLLTLIVPMFLMSYISDIRLNYCTIDDFYYSIANTCVKKFIQTIKAFSLAFHYARRTIIVSIHCLAHYFQHVDIDKLYVYYPKIHVFLSSMCPVEFFFSLQDCYAFLWLWLLFYGSDIQGVQKRPDTIFHPQKKFKKALNISDCGTAIVHLTKLSMYIRMTKHSIDQPREIGQNGEFTNLFCSTKI